MTASLRPCLTNPQRRPASEGFFLVFLEDQLCAADKPPGAGEDGLPRGTGSAGPGTTSFGISAAAQRRQGLGGGASRVLADMGERRLKGVLPLSAGLIGKRRAEGTFQA